MPNDATNNPTHLSEEPAGLGHNLPDEFDAIKARVDALVESANRAAIAHPKVDEEETAGKFRDFLEQIRLAHKAAEDERKRQKQPHADAAKAVDDRFRPLTAALDMIKKILNPKLTAYLQAKQRREQEEARKLAEEAEAARLAAEEAAAEAEHGEGDVVGSHIAAEEAQTAAKEADKVATQAAKTPTQVRGSETGRAASLRTTYSGKIVDDMKVFRRYRKNGTMLDALQRAVNAELRGADKSAIRRGEFSIPGVEIVEEQNAA